MGGFRGFNCVRSRWARLAGFEGGPWQRSRFEILWALPGETELGHAEEQPNKG